MGIFDNVRCLYPLPWPEEELAGLEWQTKDMEVPYMDHYEIRADGTLWQEKYTMRMEKNPESLLGYDVHRDNVHWEQVPWEGELEIHALKELVEEPGNTWYSVRFWFRAGVVRDMIAEKSVHRPEKKEA